MSLDIAAVANCDDAIVFWRAEKAIADCWGFSIEREQKKNGSGIQRTTLDNRAATISRLRPVRRTTRTS